MTESLAAANQARRPPPSISQEIMDALARIATGWRIEHAGPGTIYESGPNTFAVYNDRLQACELVSARDALARYRERCRKAGAP